MTNIVGILFFVFDRAKVMLVSHAICVEKEREREHCTR